LAVMTRLVSDALLDGRRIRDITGSLSVQALHRYVSLWLRIQHIHLDSTSPDKFIWKWSANQQYSLASAYQAFFISQCGVPVAKELCKTRASADIKFFVWLVILDRCWTAKQRHRHHLQDDANCNLCGQALEFIHHLLLGCVYSREVWARLLRSLELLHLCPTLDTAPTPWWLDNRRSLSKERRCGFDSLVTLVWWNIWWECNNRVFNDAMKQAAELVSWTREEWGLYIQAGCSRLSVLLQ
jgi:hypothetical protein